MSDRMISYYRKSVRTNKWTIHMLMHFTDVALVNSWLLYHRDNHENGTPRKAIMKFLEFQMIVAQVFLKKCDVLHEDAFVADAENENGHLPPPAKRSRVTPVPHFSVRFSTSHLPEMVALKKTHALQSARLLWEICRCMTCTVCLCLQSERNCFAAFHSCRQAGRQTAFWRDACLEEASQRNLKLKGCSGKVTVITYFDVFCLLKDVFRH